MMAGDAEVAFERREHLDLAWQNCALDLAMRMNRKAVLRPDALPHLAACDFALADLRARPSRGLSFSGAQDELGRGSRRERSRLIMAIDGAKLGDSLKAEHGAEPTFASAHNERFEFRLTL